MLRIVPCADMILENFEQCEEVIELGFPVVPASLNSYTSDVYNDPFERVEFDGNFLQKTRHSQFPSVLRGYKTHVLKLVRGLCVVIPKYLIKKNRQ